MSEAAKEWAAYVAARNAIETAKAARLASQPSDWEFDVLNLTVSFLRIAEAREPTTAALLFQNAVELIRQAEVFAKKQVNRETK